MDEVVTDDSDVHDPVPHGKAQDDGEMADEAPGYMGPEAIRDDLEMDTMAMDELATDSPCE